MRRITRAFDRKALARICEMHEDDFAERYGMETYVIPERNGDNDRYYYQDNGSNVLAVAHLDTVGAHEERGCYFLNTAGGEVVYSRALDDRLGAYIILDLLPKLGIQYDILLTVGEEDGMSTAEFFEPLKEYDWMIEFDRGGTDVVMYQFEDQFTVDLVKASGARVGEGIFSDICYLEHLGVKGFNWGVGYRDYHGPRAHAYLDDTLMMVNNFLRFHAANAGRPMPHTYRPPVSWWDRKGWERDGWGDDVLDPDVALWEEPGAEVMPEGEEFAEGRNLMADLIEEYPSLAQINIALGQDEV
jgi:hypothetical protein